MNALSRISTTVFAILLFLGGSFAQSPHVDRLDPASLNQQGQLLNLKIVPGNRSLQIFLVGKKKADINFGKTELTAKIRLSNRTVQDLEVSKERDHYAIPTAPLDQSKATHLELKTNLGPQTETFTIELK